jgi:site-specific recombinase XerD
MVAALAVVEKQKSELERQAEIAELVKSAARYASHSKAASTIHAYDIHWRDFTGWCESKWLVALPADPRTVALYITDQADAGRKVATISARLAAIAKAHSAKGFPSPASLRHAIVGEVMGGIKRNKGTAQIAKSAAITDVVVRMLAHCHPSSLAGARDRALLLIGFAGAFRRSELVALNFGDVKEAPEGLAITIRRSKTDQEGAGRLVGIPYGGTLESCPVRSLRAWLAASGITAGALFPSVNRHGRMGLRMTAQSVALIVKRYANAAGLDPALFAGHSLRAGLATAAAINGVSERSVMQQTGHRSAAMVRRYIRDGSLFRENAAAKVGL